MFYQWVRRLGSMQMPATSFPAAGGNSATESEESQHFDGVLIAATIASLWVWLRSALSENPASLDWYVLTYGSILLVALFGAFLVRPKAPFGSMAAHIAAYLVLATLMGVYWATSPIEAIVWAVFFGVFGVITAVLCTVVWAATLHKLPASNNASDIRLICVLVVLGAALVGAIGAVTVPLAGL
jgi:hypothetical protein